MASSEETMWGFEKVELPSAMEPILYTNSWPNPTPTDTNRSHPIVRTQDARDERDDNRSSSSNISGRPDLAQRLAKSFKIVHRRRDKLVERRVKVVHQRREHEYQRKAVQASNQRVVDATDVFLERFAIEVYSSPEYLAIVGALKESTDRARILESKETKLQESTENVNLKKAELFSKEKKVYKRLASLTGLSDWPHKSTSYLRTTSTDTLHEQQVYHAHPSSSTEILRSSWTSQDFEGQVAQYAGPAPTRSYVETSTTRIWAYY